MSPHKYHGPNNITVTRFGNTPRNATDREGHPQLNEDKCSRAVYFRFTETPQPTNPNTSSSCKMQHFYSESEYGRWTCLLKSVVTIVVVRLLLAAAVPSFVSYPLFGPLWSIALRTHTHSLHRSTIELWFAIIICLLTFAHTQFSPRAMHTIPNPITFSFSVECLLLLWSPLQFHHTYECEKRLQHKWLPIFLSQLRDYTDTKCTHGVQPALNESVALAVCAHNWEKNAYQALNLIRFDSVATILLHPAGTCQDCARGLPITIAWT